MESTCSERCLSESSDETECYLYPKRIKIESDPKIIEKEEQQKLEQSIQRVNRYETSPHETMYISERQNSWSLEKQSCDTARKIPMREFFHFQPASNEKLPCRVLENELSTKKKRPENEDQYAVADDTLWNVHRHPLETGSLNVWSAANSCKDLQVLNPPQGQHNNSIDQINKRNGDNELKQNSSGTPLNRDPFHVELLSHKSVSDKKWKQYQLLKIPFLCDTSSVFSHAAHQKNNPLKRLCTTEDKDYSSSDNETTAERDNTEKTMSSYIVPTFKPFKSIQPLEIPNFQFLSISNKINSKMSSTNLKEMDGKNFKGQPSLVQSEQICSVQKMSEVGKQKLQNDESSVKASALGSEFKEKNYQSVSKPEYSGLAEGGKASVAYFRDNSTDTEYDQIFAENYFRGKIWENSDGDDDHKSRIHIYISVKNVPNEECFSCIGLWRKTGRKSSNDKMATFHRQTSLLVVTETLEKNELDIHCGVHNSNSDISLHGAESEISAKETLDFKRYLTKTITFESNRPRSFVQNFPVKKVSCNIFTGKEMLKLKFSVQNTLFGKVRMWTESLYEDTLTCQDDGITHSFQFCETSNERWDAQELVKSNVSRSHKNKTRICLLAISKHLKVELLKTILASCVNRTNTLFLADRKSVEKPPLSGSKQVQFNPRTDNSLGQNTEFHRENETYPGFVSSKFTESIGFILHNKCQRRHFPRSLVEQASTFLKRRTLFHNKKSVLCKGRHVRKHDLLSRGNEAFSTCLRSVSHKNSMKKQILVAKCLILVQGTFVRSSLEKMYCSNITKIRYLIGANLRFWSYFPAHLQLKFEKVNSTCTNWEILLPTAKQEKKKPSKMVSGSFHGERFKGFPFDLCENKTHEAIGCKNCIKSTKEVTSEVMFTMKNYLGASGYIDADRKYLKSKELQINSDDFLYKKPFSVFDTYEKIPLTTDSEDCDQIPFVNQTNSDKKEFSEENAVSNSKEVLQLSDNSSDVLILPEPSKTAMEKGNSLFLQDSQTNQPEYCKKIDAHSPHLENKKETPEDRNLYLNFENLFPRSSNAYQSVTLPLGSCSFVNEEGVGSEDGHCQSSSRADEASQSEAVHAIGPCLPPGSPSMTGTYLQAKEPVQVFFQGHTQTSTAASSEPATLKQHPEYGKEQEEITDEQMHVTNESQCEAVMNDLITSYSERESQTFIAAEEELKMRLSVMNNGCLEDVKDTYLPLEDKITYEFGLKRKFDLVLQELHMFHEISKGDENNLSSLETNSHNNYCELNNSEGIDENVTSVPQKKTCISSPICATTEEQNITNGNENSLDEKISTENESQKLSEEYCTSRQPSEGCFDASYKKSYPWDPAFASCTLFNEQNYHFQKEGGYFLSREVIRVQPLKTCKGPIRIGLSRKARPKQLHPYLK